MSADEVKPRQLRGVVDGVLHSTSPTDVQRADPGSQGGCLRKWWYRQVARLPQKPRTKSQERGDEGHAQIKGYLSGGPRPDRSDVVKGLHRVPEPGEDLLVETYVDVELEGVRVTCKMDLAHARPALCVDPETGAADPAGTVEVKDWKFRSDGRYVPEAGDLPKDLQMALYGDYWHRRGVPAVRLTQENFVASPSGVVTRSFLARPADVAPAIERARAVVRRMIDVARETDPERVPACRDACRAFGGCDYYDTCSAPAFDPLEQILKKHLGEERTMGVLDDVRKKASAAAAAKAAKADEQAGATAEELAAAKRAAEARAAEERRAALGEDLLESIAFLRAHPRGYPPMRGRAAQAWAAEQLKVADPSTTIAGQWELKDCEPVEDPADLVKLAIELVEGEGEKTETQAKADVAQAAAHDKAAADAKYLAEQQKAIAQADARRHPASVVPPDAPASDPAKHLEAAEAKNKKGKDKTAKARAEADEATGRRTVEDVAEPTSTVLVLVDCLPVSGDFTTRRLEPYCYSLLKAIAGGADIRMSSGEDFGFGKWRSAIEAAACHKHPEPGTWLLDSRMGELAESVVAGLVRAGVTVIRGHR